MRGEPGPASSADHRQARLGTTIGERYELPRLLGRGGAACVFAAENVRVSRPVAVKIAHRDPLERDALHARLGRETKALSRVRYP